MLRAEISATEDRLEVLNNRAIDREEKTENLGVWKKETRNHFEPCDIQGSLPSCAYARYADERVARTQVITYERAILEEVYGVTWPQDVYCCHSHGALSVATSPGWIDE